MSKHPFDTLTLEDGAQLVFTPCPGSKGANLPDSIKQLKQAGTSVLLTLMFENEMSKNQLTRLPDICQQHEIKWFQLPIVDDEAPEKTFEVNWLRHQADILAVLTNKGTVAVHCKGGTGRTGLVIALILLKLGLSSESVISEVQKIRPKALINTAQLAYFKSIVSTQCK